MKLLVISTPQEIPHEVETIHELFRLGLEILHLRKPDYSSLRMEKLLKSIESRYHQRIMLHSHHNLGQRYTLRGLHFPAAVRQNSITLSPPCQSTSCHSIKELDAYGPHFEYILVSPVFDSISKPGYHAGIDIGRLKEHIVQAGSRVVGLGGISPETLQLLPSDCWGAAVLGYVWCHDSIDKRISSFERLMEIAETS
jgi:thiamine-phosphate pyrophosphorylase